MAHPGRPRLIEARHGPPFADPAANDGRYSQALNRGSRSPTLDLRAPEAHRLVERMDVVCDNLRGDLPARLGLDYAALGPVNPRTVRCALTGFGRSGLRARGVVLTRGASRSRPAAVTGFRPASVHRRDRRLASEEV